MFTPVNHRATNAYSQVAVNARVAVATPHELIDMLYDSLLTTLAQAKDATERKDIPTKGKAIVKAVRLLEEGLKGGLSPLGGELAANLRNLYDYCVRRLTYANIYNDVAAIEEVSRLIQPVAEGWKGIGNSINNLGAGHVQ